MPTTYDAATLEPVVTTVSKLPTADDDSALPTITVRADRIPWYAWLGAGLLLGFVFGRAARSS